MPLTLEVLVLRQAVSQLPSSCGAPLNRRKGGGAQTMSSMLKDDTPDSVGEGSDGVSVSATERGRGEDA